MAQEYTIFDMVIALFSLLYNGTIWLITSLLKVLFRFFSNPIVKIISIMLIIFLCIFIVKKLWSNREKSMYDLK